MLQIALPNKGTLSDEARRLVGDAGYACRRYGRELFVLDKRAQMEFIFLRPRDIAIYVSNGLLDLGITGLDLAQDSGANFEILSRLGFGKSQFRYAIPKDKETRPKDFSGLRIATSYTRLVKRNLSEMGITAQVVRLDGAVEISIRMGVADVIADVVESGRTMMEAGLKPVGEPILNSEAVLIARDQKVTETNGVASFLSRVQGIVRARAYVMIEYDAPTEMVDDACRITPGIESPTIAPLSKKGWVAIKSMVQRKAINGIMDRLAAAGAKGIIVTDIKTCRI